MLKLTGSALSTGAVYAIEYIPFLLLSLPGGVFADRFDRRRMLIFGDLTAAVIATGLALVVSAGSHALWPIYLTAFLLACVEPVYHPAFQSFLPEIVRGETGEEHTLMPVGERPAHDILGLTTEFGCGLIVLGSAGKSGLRSLWSVSETVAYHAPCSVLIVPGTDVEAD